MTQELIYTSAEQGLAAGARGFCTVASTPGMARNLADYLETLSGYKHLFPPGDASQHLNPVNFSCLSCVVGGQRLHVLSRVCDAGLDYTHRSNKLAHHVAVTTAERVPAGPAALMRSVGFFAETWQGDPRPIAPRQFEGPNAPAPLAKTSGAGWVAAAGDAAWALAVAGASVRDQPQIVWVIYPLGADVLGLFAEAIAELPERLRWRCTFSTYYSRVPPGARIDWRAVPEGSALAATARRQPLALVIDLVNGPPKPPAELVELAQQVVAGKPMAPPPTPTAIAAAIDVADLPPLASGDGDLELMPPALPNSPNGSSAPSRVSDLTGPLSRRSSENPRAYMAWVVPAIAAAAILTGVWLGSLILDSKDRVAGPSNTASVESTAAPTNEGGVIEAEPETPPEGEPDSSSEEPTRSPSPPPTAETMADEALADEALEPSVATAVSDPPTESSPPNPESLSAKPKPLPAGYFASVADAIALPKFQATQEGLATTPIAIGVVPTPPAALNVELIGCDRGSVPFSVRPHAEVADLWQIEAREPSQDQPRPIASVRLDGDRIEARWVKGRRRFTPTARAELRAGLLRLVANPGGVTKTLALRKPFQIAEPLAFSESLGAIQYTPTAPAGAPPLWLPVDSKLRLAIRVTSVAEPVPTAAERWVLTPGDTKSAPLTADGSLAMECSWSERTSESTLPTLSMRLLLQSEEDTTPRTPLLAKKMLAIKDARLKLQKVAIKAAVTRHLELAPSESAGARLLVLWNQWRTTLDGPRSNSADQTNAADLDDFYDWLHAQLRINQGLTPAVERAAGRLALHRRAYPKDRLIQWRGAWKLLPDLRLHLRVTRWPPTALGATPLPSADVLVVGPSPPVAPSGPRP